MVQAYALLRYVMDVSPNGESIGWTKGNVCIQLNGQRLFLSSEQPKPMVIACIHKILRPRGHRFIVIGLVMLECIRKA